MIDILLFILILLFIVASFLYQKELAEKEKTLNIKILYAFLLLIFPVILWGSFAEEFPLLYKKLPTIKLCILFGIIILGSFFIQNDNKNKKPIGHKMAKFVIVFYSIHLLNIVFFTGTIESKISSIGSFSFSFKNDSDIKTHETIILSKNPTAPRGFVDLEIYPEEGSSITIISYHKIGGKFEFQGSKEITKTPNIPLGKMDFLGDYHSFMAKDGNPKLRLVYKSYYTDR